MNELSLFTGAGGGIWGSRLLRWRTVGYVEWNDYCQRIIAQRIEDGYFDRAPIFSDIRAFLREGYARSYKGMVDVIAAGFPCQPFSHGWHAAKGESDERNMWPDTLRVIREIEPRWLLLENVPGLFRLPYIWEILADICTSGYDLKWVPLSAYELGADHERNRGWIVAHANSYGSFSLPTKTKKYSSNGAESLQSLQETRNASWGSDYVSLQRLAYTGDIRTVDGLADWCHRLKAAGNGQVPRVVKEAWGRLSNAA